MAEPPAALVVVVVGFAPTGAGLVGYRLEFSRLGMLAVAPPLAAVVALVVPVVVPEVVPVLAVVPVEVVPVEAVVPVVVVPVVAAPEPKDLVGGTANAA